MRKYRLLKLQKKDKEPFLMNNAAVLIDAENIGPRHIKEIFDELNTKEINLKIKRAFADWTHPSLPTSDWRKVLNTYAIRPTHLFNFSNGKNASDIQLVIFSMQTLYEHQDIDTYILVTNDSDFTPLVLALKENGKHVIGYGGESASVSLENACDEFYTIKVESKKHKVGDKEHLSSTCEHIWFENFWVRNNDGWIRLDMFGTLLKAKIKKSWASLGYKSLKDLMADQSSFEIKKRNYNSKENYYVRPCMLGGENIILELDKAVKKSGYVFWEDNIPLEKIEEHIQKKDKKFKLKDIIESNPLYILKEKENGVFIQRRMNSAEKHFNQMFYDYYTQEKQEWVLVDNKLKSFFHEKISHKNEKALLNQISLSQLAQKTISLNTRIEKNEDSTLYYYSI